MGHRVALDYHQRGQPLEELGAWPECYGNCVDFEDLTEQPDWSHGSYASFLEEWSGRQTWVSQGDGEKSSPEVS